MKVRNAHECHVAVERAPVGSGPGNADGDRDGGADAGGDGDDAGGDGEADDEHADADGDRGALCAADGCRTAAYDDGTTCSR